MARFAAPRGIVALKDRLELSGSRPESSSPWSCVVILGSELTHNAITHRFRPVSVPAHSTSRALSTATGHFLVDPGSGLAPRAH
jgi:hypothetical protein